LVYGTSVTVIEHTGRGVNTISAHALVAGTGVGVIAIFLYVQAGSADTVIIRARVVVVQSAGRYKDAVTALAKIIGARNTVIAYFGSAYASAADALVNGARIIISAIFRSKNTIAIHAGVIGAEVVIVANNRWILAGAIILAEIFGAGVEVVAFEAVEAAALARINGAGVVVRTGKGDICSVAAEGKIRSEDVIIAKGDIRPCDVGALSITPRG